METAIDILMFTQPHFLDCLREEFQKQIKEKQFTCTVPWIQSMQGVVMYNDTSIKTCNNWDDYDDVSSFGDSFAQNALTYSHPKCPGKYECTTIFILV